MAADPLALVLMKTPGELGADMCLGSAQRLGVPLGYGGPHAGFFSAKKELTKFLPGRIVGITKLVTPPQSATPSVSHTPIHLYA